MACPFSKIVYRKEIDHKSFHKLRYQNSIDTKKAFDKPLAVYSKYDHRSYEEALNSKAAKQNEGHIGVQRLMIFLSNVTYFAIVTSKI